MDDLDLQLDDVVLFELPTRELVEAFRRRIRPRWDGWSDTEEDVFLFTAELRESGDVAPLLREAERIVSELGPTEIAYCVDGRVYALEAARSGAAALATKSK